MLGFCLLSGTDWERGYQMGERFQAEIEAAFERHCTKIIQSAAFLPGKLSEADERLANAFPGAREELRGIAAGSGLSYKSILLLTYWEDMSYLNKAPRESQCTSIMFRGMPTSGLLGKTTDISWEQQPDYALLEIHPIIGYNSVQLCKIGTTKCEAGMNEKGLCVGTSTSIEACEATGEIERMTCVHQLLACCGNVGEALSFLGTHPFYRLGLNVALLDESGEMVVAECGNQTMAVRTTAGNEMVATNYYLHECMRDKYDFRCAYYQNAVDRQVHLTRRLKNGLKEHSSAMMRSLLSEHAKTGSICNHTPSCETLYSTIWNPAEHTVELCDGRPCQCPFQMVWQNEFITEGGRYV